MSDAARPLSIQVVSDGRTGIENQALGLAEAVARRTPATIAVRRVRWRAGFDLLPVGLKRPWMLAAQSDPVFPRPGEPWPDLWIATGRASLPLSVAARRRSGGRTFVVQTQDPRLPSELFDMVVAPQHDGVRGDNVLHIVGAPHRVTRERLALAAPGFAERLDPLPRPRVAVLIGGRSRAFDLTEDHARALARRVAAAVESQGGSILATFSRRTPAEAQAVMRQVWARLPGEVWDGSGDNPLFAYLEAADHVLVTEDSANMATEAAATGKPVHVLEMVARGDVGKFARLHAELTARGATRRFIGDLASWTYDPLDETGRAADAILEALAARR